MEPSRSVRGYMMRRMLRWLEGLLAMMALSCTLHAWDLTPLERKAIAHALTEWVEHLRDEGREARIPRILTEEYFTNPGKLDVVAFLAWFPTTEPEEMRTLLVVLSDPGKGYKVIASTVIDLQEIVDRHVPLSFREWVLGCSSIHCDMVARDLIQRLLP